MRNERVLLLLKQKRPMQLGDNRTEEKAPLLYDNISVIPFAFYQTLGISELNDNLWRL